MREDFERIFLGAGHGCPEVILDENGDPIVLYPTGEIDK